MTIWAFTAGQKPDGRTDAVRQASPPESLPRPSLLRTGEAARAGKDARDIQSRGDGMQRHDRALRKSDLQAVARVAKGRDGLDESGQRRGEAGGTVGLGHALDREPPAARPHGERLRPVRARRCHSQGQGLDQRPRLRAGAADAMPEDDALHPVASPTAKLVMPIDPRHKLRCSALPLPPPAPRAT